MPLANKEVVHLKNGWEKIQVRKKYQRPSSSATRDARARFLSFESVFVCSSVSSERKKTCARDRGLKIC
jgi:hypothetical protein